MGQTTFSGPVASQNGFIENSFTTAERDAIVNPTAGLLIYNTTTNTYEVYNGEGFQPAFGGGGGSTTYTQGVDYSGYGVTVAGPGPGSYSLYIETSSWNNGTWSNIISKSSGTAFTYVDDLGATQTATTSSAFVDQGSGSYAATLTNTTISFAGSSPLRSITI